MRHLIMGTAGHVDHGKTTLIKALTSVDCDTHPEEKRRGITINLGFTSLVLPGGESIGIVDVPGHKDFIHTMVSGVSGIDFVLLVVAANSGVMPQTREHLDILQTLGIKKGIIALNKIDLIDEEMVRLATEEIHSLVQGSFLAEAPIVQVSSINGRGLDELKEVISQTAGRIDEKEKGLFFRMYPDRVFSLKGYGSVLTGTVLSGEAKLSTSLYLLPGDGSKLRVRKIERYGKETESIIAGDRAAINFAGFEKNLFVPGMMLSDMPLDETKLLDAKLQLFRSSAPLSTWSNVIFHAATFFCQARIHLIDKDKLLGGESAMVQVQLEKPGILAYNDRFIFRNTSSDKTLGGGIIVDAKPLHHKRRTTGLIENLVKIGQGNLADLIRSEVTKSLWPLGIHDIAMQLNKPAQELITICNSTIYKDIAVHPHEHSLILVSTARETQFLEKINQYIQAFHKRNPLIPAGLTETELISKLGFAGHQLKSLYCRLLLEKLEQEGQIRKTANSWVSAGHEVHIPADIKHDLAWLSKLIAGYKNQTPLMSEMKIQAKRRGLSEKALKQYLHFLTRTGEIYQIDEDFLAAGIVDGYRKALLAELCRLNSGITVSGFRDLIAANRKIVLLLLSLFDAEGIVAREGDLRFITDKGVQLYEKSKCKG